MCVCVCFCMLLFYPDKKTIFSAKSNCQANIMMFALPLLCLLCSFHLSLSKPLLLNSFLLSQLYSLSFLLSPSSSTSYVQEMFLLFSHWFFALHHQYNTYTVSCIVSYFPLCRLRPILLLWFPVSSSPVSSPLCPCLIYSIYLYYNQMVHNWAVTIWDVFAC